MSSTTNTVWELGFDRYQRFAATAQLIEGLAAGRRLSILDVVVALDVLEYVPPQKRRYFLGELVRVSRLVCVVGFPIISAQAAEEFVLKITGTPGWPNTSSTACPTPPRWRQPC